MRISTNSMYAASSTQLGTLQTQLARTQMQLSTNKKLLAPSDDPIASARALEVTQSQSINSQFATNRANARSSLSQEEVVLSGVQSLIQDVQGIAVAAGGGTNAAADRTTYANELQGRLDDLIALANSSDGNGGYVFSGFRSSTPPFVKNGAAVDYNGDQGEVQLQVAGARKLAINDAGSSVFTGIATANGTFATAANPSNTGTGVVSSGSVVNPSALTGRNYSLDFAVTNTGATTYTITDQSAAPPVAMVSGASYLAGQAITVAGQQFDIKGTPGDGDQFTVKPSDRQSLFTTVSKLIDTLRAPATTDKEKATLDKGLQDAIGNLALGLDNVLAVRSSVGSRMKELDSLDSIGSDIDLQYAATLSGLQDLDIVSAISMFSQQTQTLQAAQKTFTSISGLSLFNYIS
ncbi:flagellar hook-associated protein FlgL [Massilia sp. DWR3-1-1]|uniref:flagellar hook-associated protein FlgL n=1 Tax=Massilia sp. DWR3-1-1 TaxID=2804559 RepID=UPI003CF5456A